MAKWITFNEIEGTGKTKRWAVTANEGDHTLGVVKWYGPWRGYAFFPQAGTLYERTCLRDIADFIEEQNKLKRQRPAEILSGTT